MNVIFQDNKMNNGDYTFPPIMQFSLIIMYGVDNFHYWRDCLICWCETDFN